MIRGQVADDLLDVQYFAITTDMWSSRTTDPYMALTIHWIDINWKLKSRLLQVSLFIAPLN